MDYGWVRLPEMAREALARLIGSEPDHFSINSSTSEVVGAVALGLGLTSADKVVTFHGEYPSDVLPWLLSAERGGAEVEFLSADLLQHPGTLSQHLAPNAKVCVMSHVCFQSGSMVDVVAVCRMLRARGIFSIVDVTQSLGGMPLPAGLLDVADVITCSTYKWMLAPYGLAFGWWSRRACEMVRHSHAGWLTMPQMPMDLTKYTTATFAGARRYDRGQSPAPLQINGLLASLSLLSEVGLETIWRWNQSLRQEFVEAMPRDRMEVLSKGAGSNIVCVRVDGADAAMVQSHLRTANVDVSVREGNLRISFHLFNTTEDVDRLVQACLSLGRTVKSN
jgi:cysteine desulfurase/selenocysteine lyase